MKMGKDPYISPGLPGGNLQANENSLTAGDHDETVPTAQCVRQKAVGNIGYCHPGMPPLSAFHPAEDTIRWQDYASSNA